MPLFLFIHRNIFNLNQPCFNLGYMRFNTVPAQLRTLIDGEETDFIAKSKRNHPKKQAWSTIGFSIFWNAFVSIFIVAFFGPLFTGKDVHFSVSGKPTTASLDNMDELLFPGVFIGVFLLVGITVFISGILQLTQKGGYFVGTPTRLIKYRKGKLTVKDWEQFSGNITLKTKGHYGDLELELRTGKMRKKNKGARKLGQDTIYISGISNVFDIEKKCRIRIKEHDPNPKTAT